MIATKYWRIERESDSRMPKVNPDVLAWARETAGLTQAEAARKLGLQDSTKSSGEEKLAAMELGTKIPTRSQLAKMSATYHRPHLTFFLKEPPPKAPRAADFRGQSGSSTPLSEGRLDALVRDMMVRQNIIRAALQDGEFAKLAFVGSMRVSDGEHSFVEALTTLLGISATDFHAEKSVDSAFRLLRSRIERLGVFVLLKGDLGNYHSAIPTTDLRGLTLSDEIAPFIVINDNDARAAWSFTLVHEMVHLLLGETGVGNSVATAKNEKFCDSVAGSYLLPARVFANLKVDQDTPPETALSRIGTFARDHNLSRLMVAYNAMQRGLISSKLYRSLGVRIAALRKDEKELEKAKRQEQEPPPIYYSVRRKKLGTHLLNVVRRALDTESLTATKAARVLGVNPTQVHKLLDSTGP